MFYYALCKILAEGELLRDGVEDCYFRLATDVADADADADVRRYGYHSTSSAAATAIAKMSCYCYC